MEKNKILTLLTQFKLASYYAQMTYKVVEEVPLKKGIFPTPSKTIIPLPCVK